MPALALLAVGAAGGFIAGRGVDELGGVVKWIVIGGVVYVAARAAKVL